MEQGQDQGQPPRIFLTSGLITIFLQACTGLITITVLKFFVIALPMFVLGTYIGSYFYGAIGEKLYKRIIYILLALLGAFIVYRAI